MPEHPQLLLIDGNALLHRAWHAIPPLTTSDGHVVNAVYGFCMVIEKILPLYHPTHMAVVWDLPDATFRHTLYEPYKAQREKKAPELYAQIPMIQELLNAYGIISESQKGFEADDLLATFAQKATQAGIETRILTGDRDTLQLVTPLVHVVCFKKGLSETIEYTPEEIQKEYELSASQMIDYKTLRGDPSDNLPGVAGIGEKTATELLKAHGTIQGILTALKNDAIPEKYAKKLKGQEQTLEQMKTLVTLVRDVPTPLGIDDLKRKPIDTPTLVKQLQRFEFQKILQKYQQTSQNELVAPPKKEEHKKSSTLTTISSPKAWKDYLQTLQKDSVALYLVPQPEDLFGNTSAALFVSDGEKTAVYLQPTKEVYSYVSEEITSWKNAVSHDWKTLTKTTGIPCNSNAFDLMIASHLLRTTLRTQDIPSIWNEWYKESITLPLQINDQKAQRYYSDIIQRFPKLKTHLAEELEKEHLTSVFTDIEMPLISILASMEDTGITLDQKAASKAKKDMEKDVEQLTKSITQHAGKPFNIASPAQLGEVLFEHLKLPTKGLKKTVHGYSTAAPELEKIEGAHPILEEIALYREYTKLLSTYLDVLPGLVKKDGRIHTTYHQTIAATGRLSSTNPNLQNIPIKTERGNDIRRAFVAAPGKVFISADYSQIELRVVAVLSKDTPFLDAFKQGADIHTRTASQVFNKPEDQVTSEERRQAKAVNFGILYGMGPHALARAIHVPYQEAVHFLDLYFQIHHNLKHYFDDIKNQAHTKGFVSTFFGRKRDMPEITSNVQQLVASAERMAMNMPIQGTAADIVKMAMISVHQWLEKTKWPAKLILQVHDELILEVDEEALPVVASGIKQLMEHVVQWEIPLEVNIETGKNWGDLSPWNG